MSGHVRVVVIRATAAALAVAAALLPRQILARQSPSINATLFRELQWRSLEPLRAGATTVERVTTDTAFPYRVCAAVRESPAACVSSARGDEADATTWSPVARRGASSIAPDPADPDVVFTANAADGVRRFDRRTGQTQDVTPPATADDRVDERAPLVFAPAENRALYFGTTRVWKTANGGQSWIAASASLSGAGAISAIAPSPIDARTIWAGTSEGLVQVSRDGALTWNALTIPGLNAATRVSMVEPSHFDASTAYVALTSTTTGPHFWRTRDGGATWAPIVRGLPERSATYVVREDPFRRGLLFAGTDDGPLVSFDDGEYWQSLAMNLPPVPVVDLTIREADIVVATTGQGLWILDDVAPLRQVTPDIARAGAFLFRPSTAWRVKVGLADNGTSAAALDYLVGPNVSGPVTIEIIETPTGDVIRRFSSAPTGAASSDVTPISGVPGLHRVWWDVRYTPIDRRGVAVLPGIYQVRLTAGTATLRQAVSVRMDPRIRATAPDLTAEYKLARAVDDQRREIASALARTGADPPQAARGESLRSAMAALNDALDRIQQSDAKPTSAAEAAAGAAIARALAALAP